MIHWGKADHRNCNHGHPKMVDTKPGKNPFRRSNCFHNAFQMTHALVRQQSMNPSQGNHKLQPKNAYERENPTQKIAKITDHNSAVQLRSS